MADELFDLLIKARDAAEVANGNAQEIIRDYRRKPDFSYAANSMCAQTRRAQERAAAKEWLECQHNAIRHIHESTVRFREGTHPALDLIRRAVALKVPPIFVADYSHPTAHEAAEALGSAVREAWERGGGYYAVEHAPDRMQAEWDSHDADAAIEVSIEIWKRLRRLRKNNLPPDLWGQIQQEFEAAAQLLDAESDAANEPETVNDKRRQSPMVVNARHDFDCALNCVTDPTTIGEPTAAAMQDIPRIFRELPLSSPERSLTGNAILSRLVQRGHSQAIAHEALQLMVTEDMLLKPSDSVRWWEWERGHYLTAGDQDAMYSETPQLWEWERETGSLVASDSKPDNVTKQKQRGQVAWKVAQSLMLVRLKDETLPRSIRDAAKAIGKTYSTTRTAARKSDALKTHFGLSDEKPEPLSGELLEELTSQADARTKQFLARLSPIHRAKVETQLQNMSADKRLELLKILAKSPDGGSCGDRSLRDDE